MADIFAPAQVKARDGSLRLRMQMVGYPSELHVQYRQRFQAWPRQNVSTNPMISSQM